MWKRTASLCLLLGLTACGTSSNDNVRYDYPDQMDRFGRPTYEGEPSVFGEDGLLLLGSRTERPDAGGSGIGVNAFLWRASLDTLNFLPLASADPFGGVIITDWYTPPDTPDERFKVNVLILGSDLRADGVRATVFRQARDEGGWADAPSAENSGREIEDAILTRARELRIAGLN